MAYGVSARQQLRRSRSFLTCSKSASCVQRVARCATAVARASASSSGTTLPCRISAAASSAESSPRSVRRRSTRASRTNRQRSCAVVVARHLGIDSFEKPACALDRADRNQRDVSAVRNGIQLFARLEAECLADLLPSREPSSPMTKRKRPVSARSRAFSLRSASGDARATYSFDQGKLVETEKIATPSLLLTSSGVPSSRLRSLPSAYLSPNVKLLQS